MSLAAYHPQVLVCVAHNEWRVSVVRGGGEVGLRDVNMSVLSFKLRVGELRRYRQFQFDPFSPQLETCPNP
jgi:hypothetical protein